MRRMPSCLNTLAYIVVVHLLQQMGWFALGWVDMRRGTQVEPLCKLGKLIELDAAAGHALWTTTAEWRPCGVAAHTCTFKEIEQKKEREV